jgi:NAD(P)-dependent dehydrogenase (short-subunit alcohol dehydrogenase family)
MRGLKGKVIVVTGGNGLIGKNIVARLKEEGATCYNVDISNHESELPTDIQCDITNPEEIRRVIDKILLTSGKIDGWVNNAYPRTDDWGHFFEQVSLDSWRKNIDMQLNAVFYCCQLVLEIMKKQSSGHLVNVASIYGVVGNDFTIYEDTGGMTSPAAYSAIKAGIINFTRYLASYYGRYNINVNSVSPGGVFNGQNEAFVSNFSKRVPLKRMANASEIAPAIAFLLSDDSKYITGHNLIVDGGWTAI